MRRNNVEIPFVPIYVKNINDNYSIWNKVFWLNFKWSIKLY